MMCKQTPLIQKFTFSTHSYKVTNIITTEYHISSKMKTCTKDNVN